MKFTFFTVCAMLVMFFTSSQMACAQDAHTVQLDTKDSISTVDYLLYFNNMVYEVKKGKQTPMREIAWMSNGVRVTPNGNILFEDGTVLKLSEGDIVDSLGRISNQTPINPESPGFTK